MAELIEVADLLGAGAAKALLGKDVLPDDLPWVTGSIGLLGTTASWHLMRDCDTLLTVGSDFPYTQFLPDLDEARAVQIDHSGKWIGMRYPYEINLVGDAKATLQALIPLLARKPDRSWREHIEKLVASWWTTAQRTAMTDADPLNPMRIFWELSERMPDNAIIASDSGSSANWYARHLKFSAGVRGSLSGTLATMGPGVPYVIGAKWAHPDRPAIAFVGDGAMQMNGINELITISKYWRQWSDPRLIIAILHNNDLNQVTWEMRAMENSPKFEASQSLPDVDFAGRPQPGPARRVHRRSRRARRRVGARARPPTGPPCWTSAATPTCLPSPARHVEQAKSLVEAVLGGDEDARGFDQAGRQTESAAIFPQRKEGPLTVPVGAVLHAIRTGRFERTLSALTAAGAVVTTAEIYFSHDGASFGNRMMYWPIVIVPTAVPAGLAGFFSRRAAHTVPPMASALIVANGLQGAYLHLRGIPSAARRADEIQPWNPGRRRSRRCSPRWSAEWDCWPRCCAARTCPCPATARADRRSSHRSTTPSRPEHRGRFPRVRCPGSGRALGPGDRRCRAGPVGAAADAVVFHPRRSGGGRPAAGSAAGPRQRPQGAGWWR